MKKKWLALIAIPLLLSTAALAEEKIRIVTGEWDPYTSEHLPGNGFFAEIVTAVFKEMGMDVSYEFHPWKRCESLLINGDAFAAMPYVATEERRRFHDFSDVVAVSTGRFFYLKSRIPKDLSWEKYADLKPYKIGGVLGYWYEKEFNEAGLTVDYVPTKEANMRKLQIGRVDLVPMDELVGWRLLNQHFPNQLSDFETLKKPTNISELYLMVSRAYPESETIRNRFNASLKSIREKGGYARILKKYNIKE